jgi:hypothetical protein
VALLPFDALEAAELLAPIPSHEQFSSWHLVHPDGRYASRGAAGIELLEALGHTRAAALAGRFRESAERLYALVAAHRDTLGRLVPHGPAPRRFP